MEDWIGRNEHPTVKDGGIGVCRDGTIGHLSDEEEEECKQFLKKD